MPSKPGRPLKEYALIFVEGDTEVEFFNHVLETYIKGIPKFVNNLKGNPNIYRKILGKTTWFLQQHKNASVRLYCFIDRESRDENPPLDLEILKEKIFQTPSLQKKVKSVDIVLATQMIESWYFYDVEGIFSYLRVPTSERKPEKFQPVEKLTYKDLKKLFKQNGKFYAKGEKSGFFIESLNIDKIFKSCRELQDGVNLIKQNSQK